MTLDLTEKLKLFNELKEQIDPIGINSRVLFVDSMNSYIRCFVSTPTMNDDGEHMGGVTGFLKSIGLVIRQFHPTRVVCVFDGAGGSQRRRKLHENYKNKKRSMSKLNRTYDFKNLNEEQLAMKDQLKLLVKILDYLPVDVFAVENIEADDVIGYLSTHVTNQGGQSTIMSTDKDFIQLINENCKVYNPIKKKMYDENEIVKEYGIHPHNFLLFRTLDGDVSDNILGVKGVGKISLLKNFPFLVDSIKYSVDSLVEFCQSTNNKSSICKKIIEAQQNGLLQRNEELMKLDEIHISGTTKIKIIDQFNEVPSKLNKQDLTKILAEYKLLSSFGNYDEWLMTTWVPLSKYCKD